MSGASVSYADLPGELLLAIASELLRDNPVPALAPLPPHVPLPFVSSRILLDIN